MNNHVLDAKLAARVLKGAKEVEVSEVSASKPRRKQGEPSCNGTAHHFSNFREEEPPDGEGTAATKVGLPIAVLGSSLLELTDGWPKRVGDSLFIEGQGHKPLWLDDTDSLFAWIGGRLGGQGGSNPVRWVGGHDKVTKGEFTKHLQQVVEEFDAVEAYPHYPPMPRTHYMHQKPKGGNGRASAELLARFKPLTAVDGDLLRAFFLSLFWGGEPGQRPAWLFTSDENDPQGGRGVGKSKVVQMAARLVGGHVDGSPGDPIQDLVTRLLSADALSKRIVLLDNIKTLRFSLAELEALITNNVISGRRLYAGEGQRPNTLTYCLTLNGASLSRDMAQRCVIVKMARPDHSGKWEKTTTELIESKRWAIIGDCLAALEAKPEQPIPRHSRWGAWDEDVLRRVPDPSECMKVIAERREEVDDDAAESDIVRDAFIAELSKRGHDPAAEVIWIPTTDLAAIVREATNEVRPHNKITPFLRTLTIPELRESRRGSGRGWTWYGAKADAGSTAIPIYRASQPIMEYGSRQ